MMDKTCFLGGNDFRGRMRPNYPQGVYPARGGDLVSTLPGCVCRKVKDMGPFSASSE